MLLLVARLVDVQVLRSSGYSAAARGESSITVSLPSLRGAIYARDGSPFALSVPTDDVVADDYQVAHPVQTALALSPMLHVPATTLASELHRPSGYVVLARQLPQATGQTITNDDIPGITLLADSKRVVPNGNLALPVVGFTNAAGHGAGGLEYGYNSLLAGKGGKETIQRSTAGVALPQAPVTDKVAGTPGTGLELTLDSQLQYESEQALAKAIETSNALSGTAVVMDVKTGQILSMANLSATHPSALGAPPAPSTPAASTSGVVPIGSNDAVEEAPNNLAVTQLYEPGSVFKLVTFSAALQNGLINPNSVFTVPDQIMLDGSTFHDAEPHPTEQLTATQILAQSSNIGTSEIAQGVGEPRLLNQVKALGFGQPTGLAFPGESPGLLATAAQWEPTDYVSLPIGQVDAVERAAGARCLQRRRQRRRVRRAEAGPGDDQPVGDADPDARVGDPPGVLAAGRRRALVHAPAGGQRRNGHQRRRSRLHGCGQDGHGPDPHARPRLLHHRRLHGVLRGLRAGGEPDAVDDRRARPAHADLRRHGGGTGVLADHELCAAPLRHPDDPRCTDQPSRRGRRPRRRATRPRTSRDPAPHTHCGRDAGVPGACNAVGSTMRRVPMNLLLDDIEVIESVGDLSAVEVGGISHDSRRVVPGDLFCCVPGRVSDGHAYAAEAVERGAVGLLCEHFIPDLLDERVVQTRIAEGTMRPVMARLAAAFYGHPARDLVMVGVTGTNGKTTVTHILGDLLGCAGPSDQRDGDAVGRPHHAGGHRGAAGPGRHP